MEKNDGRQKKPFWKKWWFWAIIAMAFIGGAIENTESDTEEPVMTMAEASTETEAITETEETIDTETTMNLVTEQLEDSEVTEKIEPQEHIYDNAVIKDIVNGSRTEKIGEYSIINIDSKQVTKEALTDWYFNYVATHDFNWCMILYTDSDNYEGVYAIEGMVEKDVSFEQDEYGDYAKLNSSKSVLFAPSNGGLSEIKFSEED